MGSPNWVRSAPVLCTFPELMLSGLEPGWRYQFRIKAQNALGLSEPSELSDPLTVTLQRTASIAPRFDAELKDFIAIESEQAEFLVVYMGVPTPKISWFKDGFEIFNSRRTTITTDSGKSVLIIYKTLIDDEGEIKCCATNRAGHISTRAKLIVEAPPRVKFPRQYEDGLLFEQGETIRLKATNGGRPPPSITWYHNNEIICVDQRHNFESITDNETILKIQDAKRQDRGEYTIRAINKLGEDVASFLVTVTDRPAAPGKIIVTGTMGRSITLKWKEPDDDGGCKIGSYIVEYFRIGWDVWLKAATCRKTTVTLNDLIEGSQYRFRVKAENPYGVSDPNEESDTIFIPDPKRGIIEPNMRAKSASHRDIPRGRIEKREIMLNEPTQRTRSLTREGSNRGLTAAYERTDSSQYFLASSSSRVSHTDSRVTFVFDKSNCGQDKPPEQLSKEILLQPGNLQIIGRATSLQTTAVIRPNFDDSGGQMSYLQPRSCLSSPSRSLSSTLSALKPTPDSSMKEEIGSFENDLSPTPIPRRRRSSDASASLRTILKQDEESMLHDSSEFMLVLYPKDTEEPNQISPAEEVSESIRHDSRSVRIPSSHLLTIEAPIDTEEEDLIPPPMSLSLPELFSPTHQIVEIIREAVSSTELLHERAMERFYRAIEAEKSSLKSRIKFQASDADWQKFESDQNDGTYPLFSARTRPVRRRMSNSGGTTTTWMLKRDRRRSSEGQARVPTTKLPNVFITAPLENVSSDPNLLISSEIIARTEEPWMTIGGIGGSVERLRRWHEPGLDLSNEKSIAEMIDRENMQNMEKEDLQKSPKITVISKVEEDYDDVTPDTDEILAEDSVESSGVSSEEESTDSEDLKQLKARIMAIPVADDEDTYHPHGHMVLHVDSIAPPPVPLHNIVSNNCLTAVSNKPNVSSIQITPTIVQQPKSILKKRTEVESLFLNEFSKPIPPEKPIRKSIPNCIDSDTAVTCSSTSISNLEFNNDIFTLKQNISLTTPSDLSAISRSIMDADIDKEAVISAGEAAVTKRRQMKHGSKTILSMEDNEEEKEEKMAVVSHYTELVQQYSNPESRQRSLSRDREQKLFNSPSESRVTLPVGTQQLNVFKERQSMNPVKVITPILPAVALMPSKIITTIPPLLPTTPILKAKPITLIEQNSRCGSMINKTNTIESEDLFTRETFRRQELMSEGGRLRKNSVDDSINVISTQKRTETRSRPSSRNESRPESRNESPIYRSRNIARDQELSRPESRNESKLSSGIKSFNGGKNSRPSSRSSSRDRSRASTPIDMQMERLQRALEDRQDRLRRTSVKDDIKFKEEENDIKNIILAINAERKVRTTISYITDVVLLMAAIYVYLFKKEILAVPIIGLLLYRYIQEEIRNWIPHWWEYKNKRH